MSWKMDAPEPTRRQQWLVVIALLWPLCGLAILWTIAAVAHV